jgi:transcriptional regulator with XRE-family HTH domain
MDSIIEVAKRLVIAREACQLLKHHVANGLGVHASTIMRWENGHRRPKEPDLAALASIYQVEPEWLLNGAMEDAPARTLERREKAKAVILKMREGKTEDPARQHRRTHAIPSGGEPRRQIGIHRYPVTEETLLLDGISERVRQILLAQTRLPILPEVPLEIIRGIRDGIVVPSSWLVFKLARHLNVYEYWLLRGEPSKDQAAHDQTEGQDVESSPAGN